MNIGVDMGASAVKLCGLRGEDIVFTHYESGSTVDVPALLDKFGVDSAEVEELALTGLFAQRSGLEGKGFPIQYVSEPEAIGAGAVWLSGRDDAIVTSIGTGTAFVLARDCEYTHLCGTGVGGGTLRGLAERVLGVRNMSEFDRMALAGDPGSVDLLIGDFVESYGDLDPNVTASNLARLNGRATDDDWAAGLTNLVLQTLGTMSMMACRGQGASCVIVIGAMAGCAPSRINFKKFASMYGVEYIIPTHYECATAIGAARLAAWN